MLKPSETSSLMGPSVVSWSGWKGFVSSLRILSNWLAISFAEVCGILAAISEAEAAKGGLEVAMSFHVDSVLVVSTGLDVTCHVLKEISASSAFWENGPDPE